MVIQSIRRVIDIQDIKDVGDREGSCSKCTESLTQCQYQPDFLSKVLNLFKNKDCSFVITNPSQIFNLLQSTYMVDQEKRNPSQYYTIYGWILHLLPINLLILYDHASVLTLHGKLTFTSYLIQDIKTTTHLPFRQTTLRVFYAVCKGCVLKYSQIKRITNALTDSYYSLSLTLPLLQTCFRMLEAALQYKDIFPQVCLRGQKDSLRIILYSTKWLFSKGMTLFIWFTPLTHTFQLLTLSTQQHSLSIQVKHNTITLTQPVSLPITDLSIGSPILLVFEMQPNTLFKPTTLRMVYNNVSYNIPCPPFTSDQYLTQFNLLNDMVGTVSSIVLCGREQAQAYHTLNHPHGLFNEQSVWDTIDKNILKKQHIIGIFNGERVCEGVMLNYVSKYNHICFQGLLTKCKSQPQHQIDVFLPFLYLMSVYAKTNPTTHHTKQFVQLFDLIFQRTLKTIVQNTYKPHHTLYLLYFLQINDYPVTTSTLQHLTQSHSYHVRYTPTQLDIVNKFKQQIDEIEEKVNLLYYLQHQWEEEWQRAMLGWWEPSFYTPQINQPFHTQPPNQRVKWHLSQFIGNDNCKCFLQPHFTLPLHINKYSIDPSYLLKTNIHHLTTPPSLTIQKVSKRKIDKIREIFTTKLFEERTAEVRKAQMQSECILIQKVGVVLGVVSVVDKCILFRSRHNTKQYDHLSTKAFSNEYILQQYTSLDDIRWMVRKRFNGRPHTFLIRTKDGRDICLYFHLKNSAQFASAVDGVPMRQPFIKSQEPNMWIDRQLSNYQYLLWLNYISGRSYCDLTQYPILPWTAVSDEQPSQMLRDLSLNMGSLGNEERKKHFIEKFNSKNEGQLFDEYHYGTHYSSSAIIVNYLIRIQPYTSGSLSLQSGKFDCADRIFASYLGSYTNATCSPTDVRQLIPQIYTLPQMLFNINHCQFGETQLNNKIDLVQLPKWAENNPYTFVSRMRSALESEKVSANIHHWIDLIYGYKQRGKDAVDAMNIFYPLTYQDAIDLDQVKDPEEKLSFETQIAHFGQHPAQIIGLNPHPARKKTLSPNTLITTKEFKIQKCILPPIKQELLPQTAEIYHSVFQHTNSVLAVKFITQDSFFVLRKHQYIVFDMKEQFLSKQHNIQHELQSCQLSIDYKQLSTHFPLVVVSRDLAIVGGFYNGHLQFLYTSTPHYNTSTHLPLQTTTALTLNPHDQLLYVGDSAGFLHVYRLQTKITFLKLHRVSEHRAHERKINCIQYSYKANTITTCSDDGEARVFTAYPPTGHNCLLLKVIKHPMGLPVIYASVCTTPLYSLVFYSNVDTTIYSYSINGQFLQCVVEKTGFIYGLCIVEGNAIYLNTLREIFIDQMPYIKMVRKIKLKKDKYKISCFECQGKVAIAGSEDGGLQIISCE